MSQLVFSATKYINIKQFPSYIKRILTGFILTDTALMTFFVLAVTLTGLMFMKTSFTQSNEEKSVAWYVANIKAAQAKNTECRKDSDVALQSTSDCVNALHAIEISFK